MAKHSKNNGKFREDSIVNQFRKDARMDTTGSAAAQCMNRSKGRVTPKPEVRMSFAFIGNPS